MKTLGIGRGMGIAAALLALPLLCPVTRAGDAPAASRGAWIGVSTRGLSDNWREREDYWARGVMVVDVARGGPADQAGMGPGDVLVSVDSHTLQNPADLTEAESGMQPGRPVPVVLAREGGRMIKIFNLEPGAVPGTAEFTPTPPVTAGDAAAATREPLETAAAATVAAEVTPAPAEIHRTGSVLGVRCANLSFDLADAVGSLEGQGVLVLSVAAGSPADRAGIRGGDVISWVGSQPVVDVARLDRAVATAPARVSIVTRRGETTRNVTVEFEASASAASGGTAGAHGSDLATDPLVAALRDEVRSLHDEVQKLREEIAVLAKGSAARLP